MFDTLNNVFNSLQNISVLLEFKLLFNIFIDDYKIKLIAKGYTWTVEVNYSEAFASNNVFHCCN